MCRVQRGTAAFELSRWFCMNRSSSTIMVQRRQGRTACRNVHIAQNKVHDDIYRLTLFSHHHHHPSIDIKQKEICKPKLTLLNCILLCCLGFLTKAEGFVVIRFFFPELTIRRSHVGAEISMYALNHLNFHWLGGRVKKLLTGLLQFLKQHKN